MNNNNFKLDFCIAGVQKGGTTSASYFFKSHPDIVIPKHEVQFFNNNEYENTIKEYENVYFKADAPDDLSCGWKIKNNKNILYGEKTPDICCHTWAINRLYDLYPNCKIIMFLRNPVDRCYSHYRMDFKKFGNDWAKKSKHGNPYSFEEIIEFEGDGENPINRGKYAIQLENLFHTFSKYNVHIAISERCKENTFIEYQKIFEFLERPIEKYEDLLQKYLKPSSTKKKFQHIQKYPKMQNKTKKYLQQLYKPYNELLFDMLGYEIKEWSV